MQKKTIFLMAMSVVLLALVFVGCPDTGDDGYAIGDTGPGGGIVFYDKGSTSDGWRYLEAAPTDASGTYAWASSEYINNPLPAGQIGGVIGTGKANTAAILAFDSDAPAAKACKDYSSNGKTDWFLPSWRELKEMYQQRATIGIGSFTTADSYWSSTQVIEPNNNQAGCLRFDDPEHDTNKTKENQLRVRPVRAF
jgi:hypothetical protein